jgi:segregation and condensation protein A
MDEEPVEILVGMAERGEIDPWNIDIVEVTDRFLEELERLKELDLRISGRTLFYAATLLRLKSEYFECDEDREEILDECEEFGDDFGFDGYFDGDDVSEPIERLEREIQRRIRRKQMRKRPVTLYELIKELKTLEKEERRRQKRRRLSSPILIEPEDIAVLAHEENYESATSNVLRCFEKNRSGRDGMPLSHLCTAMGMSLAEVYIPLLFLMLEGKLYLSQDEFFGEITVSQGHA